MLRNNKLPNHLELSEQVNRKVIKDDIALDDVASSAHYMMTELQDQIETYNLNSEQVAEVLRLMLVNVTPDERLYSAIEGQAPEKLSSDEQGIIIDHLTKILRQPVE